MTKDEFNILNSFYNGHIGHPRCSFDIDLSNSLRNMDAAKSLIDKGYLSNDGTQISKKGIQALDPYRVKNAIILAAGASTRFIPLSLERPKGLYEVKGERLIERQISQLISAGISDITVVLGYKKEMFYYLKEKYNVKLIINESFNVKNNIESIYLAKEIIGNSYICVSDSYFVENPFNQYEYRPFNAGVSVFENTEELYVDIDEDDRIVLMETGRQSGRVLLGHAYWNKEFSNKFIELAKNDRLVGKYSQSFWEWLVKDNLELLPPFFFKEYKNGNIFEFDYFEDLRRFDNHYLGYTHSEIIRNIKLVFRCEEDDIVNFRNVSKGLTNTSFIFNIKGIDYIYRHPGDGTENIISRKNEKRSLIEAYNLGLDPTYVYEDVNEGWKISAFVHDFREPDYDSFEDSIKILGALRKLHSSNIKMDYGIDPWADALKMEEMINKTNPTLFSGYEHLKEKVKQVYEKTLDDNVKKCFCHGDTYKPNWMIKPDGTVILIDWEYAGYSDPGIDVGYYIVDAMYDYDEAKRFIIEYLQVDDNKLVMHYMSYTSLIAYYWFVWALYREMCGAIIGEALENWRYMAEKYADYVLGN